MFIGWQYMHQRYINWQMAFIKQIGNIAEEHRNKIGPAFIHRFAHTVTHEHTVDIEDAFILWLINSNIASTVINTSSTCSNRCDCLASSPNK